MISILSVMLVSLGFLAALLIALLVAPAYRRRAVRLTTEDIKRSMPLTEAEIRADKDRIRAEYAIQLHEFERKLENASLDAARQAVEINRRDALISGLEGEIGKHRTNLDEHENARRVLEHTVMDRLPKVEHRLAEAKKLLFHRDREISILTQSAEKQGRALDEATQINTQQRDEIHRLNAAITTRVARNREGLGDARFDGEVALRSEIEALRAKTRDQASLITRLQTLLVRAGVAADGVALRAGTGASIEVGSSDGDLVNLRGSADAGDAAASMLGAAQPQPVSAIETELRALKSETRDQATEIARLKAALATFEAGETDERGQAKDSKIAMKARLAALQAENETQTATIQNLRTEIAGTNERLARQAAHFRDEMRRLGAGTVPATADPRRTTYDEPPRRSLTDRINEPRPRIVSGSETASAPSAVRPVAISSIGARAADAANGNGNGSANGGDHGPSGEAPTPAAAPASAQPAARRSRLLERLTGTETPGG